MCVCVFSFVLICIICLPNSPVPYLFPFISPLYAVSLLFPFFCVVWSLTHTRTFALLDKLIFRTYIPDSLQAFSNTRRRFVSPTCSLYPVVFTVTRAKQSHLFLPLPKSLLMRRYQSCIFPVPSIHVNLEDFYWPRQPVCVRSCVFMCVCECEFVCVCVCSCPSLTPTLCLTAIYSTVITLSKHNLYGAPVPLI